MLFAEAYERTEHCGPEEQIIYYDAEQQGGK